MQQKKIRIREIYTRNFILVHLINLDYVQFLINIIKIPLM